MLEHDGDDRYLTQSFFDENKLAAKIDFVLTSDQLFNYLAESASSQKFPALILLNIQSGPQDIIAVIKSLKSTPVILKIPVIVLSGIEDNEKSLRCYEAGAASYIVKPDLADTTSEKILSFFNYWFKTVKLPVIR
jgi:response regulator RpfG family c-di-GMP phosphodiesterase